MSDIRKWFMKQHDKSSGNGSGSKSVKPTTLEKPAISMPEKPVHADQESSGRRKTSKYFATDKQNTKEEKKVEEVSAKRKVQKGSGELSGDVKPPLGKKFRKVDDDDDDDDFVLPNSSKGLSDVTPSKKLKSGMGRGIAKKFVVTSDEDDVDYKDTKSHLKSGGRGRGGKSASAAPVGGGGMDIDESDGDDVDDKNTKSLKSSGRGRGGRGTSTAPAGGRGRGGGGRGGFMNFGERKDPPHKGEKEVPEGAPDCLAGLTFVISGTLDSLEREEAEDLIKRHGGRVTGSVSKKTNFLLCDEDIEGRKSSKAKELGTAFLTEDGLLDKIRASNTSKTAAKGEPKKPADKMVVSLPKKSPQRLETKKSVATKGLTPVASPAKRKDQLVEKACLPWTEKYRPKIPNDMIGNQSLVKQLHDWLAHWDEQFMNTGKGKKTE